MSEDILKAALTTAVTDVLIPEKLDPILAELADKLSPLRSRLKRQMWDTNVFEWNARSALVSANFYNENSTFSDSYSTYARRTATIKMLKAEGSVSNLMIKTSKGYINSLQAEIESAMKSLVQKEEWALINGNATTDTNSFDGLSQQITSNVVNAAGATINLDLLDQAIRKCQDTNGVPDLIVMSPREHMEINRQMRASMTYNYDVVDQKTGTRLVSYLGIPIIASPQVPTNLNSNNQSVAYVLDTKEIVVPVVQEVTYEKIEATTDAVSFRIKEYLTLAVKAQEKCAKISNLGKPINAG